MSVWSVLETADKHATLAINAFSGGFTDALMPVLSNRLVWIPAYLLLLWYLWKRLGWKKTLLVLIAVAVAIAAADQLANLVKYSARRFRPCWDDWMVENGLKILERKGSKYGFFSAHAATTAALATTVLAFLKRLPVGACNDDPKPRYRALSWLLGFYVLGVSISRIYVGKHFLGDVLVGLVVGILLGWAVYKVLVNISYICKITTWEK
ncbi:MAG: phosphatase PAP2 family protein [Bacteroidales bacterium]|nr:phosphatase PAP2 family protein [Bacteroidales bacterium]